MKCYFLNLTRWTWRLKLTKVCKFAVVLVVNRGWPWFMQRFIHFQLPRNLKNRLFSGWTFSISFKVDSILSDFRSESGLVRGADFDQELNLVRFIMRILVRTRNVPLEYILGPVHGHQLNWSPLAMVAKEAISYDIIWYQSDVFRLTSN